MHFLNHDALTWSVALIFLLLPTGTAPPLMGVGLAGLIWLLSRQFNQIPLIIKAPWFKPMFLFLALPWIGLLYSQDMDLGVDYAMKTKYWCLIFITASLPMDDRRTALLVKALWIGLLAGALLAMAQVSDLVPMIRKEFAGFGIVHTLVCMYLLVGILMAAFYFKRAESLKAKCLLMTLLMLFALHLVVLNGRSGYLIFILISPMVAKDLMYKFSWVVKIIVTVILCFSIFTSPIVQTRLNSTIKIFKNNKDKVLHGQYVDTMPRFYILKISIDSIISHPFTGMGTGCLSKIDSPKKGMTHPHNSILYMGVSFGLLGIISILWVFWTMFSISWRSRHTPLGYFVFSSTLVLFIGGMFDSQILNTGTLIMIAMIYGFLNILCKQQIAHQKN